MPTDPPNPAPAAPDAPRAATANFVPWEIAHLSGIGSPFEDIDDPLNAEPVAIAQTEFFVAPYAAASPTQWTIAPVQRHTTVYQITTSPGQPAQEEQFSPIYLQRAVAPDEPLARPDTAQATLRDIAGSPVSNSPSMLTNTLSTPDELLSSPSGNHPVLRFVTPEFDSTHQIMRIPVPQAAPSNTVLPLSLDSAVSCATSLPGIAAYGSEEPHTPGREASMFQPDICQLHTPSLSLALGNAWLVNQPRPATTTENMPQSAPPPLTRLPAVLPPMQRALDQHERSQEINTADSDSDSTEVEVVGSPSLPSHPSPGSGASGDL